MTTQTEELLSPAGTAVLALVAQAREAGEAPLATAARLRRDYPAELVAAATAQDELRVGRAKFSRAARMLFTRAGLEQASSDPRPGTGLRGWRPPPRAAWATWAAVSAGT